MTTDLAALFPPLIGADDRAEDALVDIRVDDIALPPLERAVESAVYAALRRWNELDPVAAEAALPYMERIGKYQRLVSALLYQSEDAPAPTAAADDQGAGAGAPSAEEDREQRKRLKSGRRRWRKQQQQLRAFQDLFGSLPDIAGLRKAREPSARLQQFVDAHRPKKQRLAQKRSAADTTTARSFEFARQPPPPLAPGDGQEEDMKPARAVDDTDPVLWIDVLHASKDPAKTQSFLVRGSQPLASVLDLVACAYDERLHEHNRGARLVFFGGQFYADTRVTTHQDAAAGGAACATGEVVDYSKEIRAWLHAKPSRLAKYGCSPMAGHTSEQPTRSLHDTRFSDLQLLVDVPGVYIHQGECEHLLRLRDARLPHEWDERGTSAFPMRLPNTLYRSLRNCFICQHYSAKFVCYGDRLSVSDPMFFCNRCYRAAHYDRDGQLLYSDFQSFPFVQE